MPKITIVQVIYNNKRFIEPVFGAIFNQTYKDFNIVAVISGNEDGGREFLAEKFPEVEIIDPGFNIGFAAGHNLVFGKYDSEFFQLVNPDLIMEPDYVANILTAFDDPKVGAATGKLYQVAREEILNFPPTLKLRRASKFQISNQAPNVKTPALSLSKGQMRNILDTTGVIIGKSGRARDRGQHEQDRGQYDKDIRVEAVSAAGAMYRKSALESVKIGESENRRIGSDFSDSSSSEYFDPDFHSYWEDVDLAWRMANAGWKNIFVPFAVGYHGRGAGSSENGYADVLGFIRHHKKLSPRVRQLNYQNHIFMYIKNARHFYFQFFVREFFMFWYILIFETGTFKILPQMLKLFPKMFQKRKLIKKISAS